MSTPASSLVTPARSTDRLASDADAINAGAWTALFDRVPASVRSELGLDHRVLRGGLHLVATGVDHLLLNRLVLAPPVAIAEAVGRFRQLGVPRFMLTFEQDELPGALALGEPFGLTRFRRPWQTMARDDAAPLPPAVSPAGVAIVPARDEHVRAMSALYCDAFDLPPQASPIVEAAVGGEEWTTLVALDGHEVVGVGISHQRGTQASLVGGAVRQSHRRRGIQRALVLDRVRRALERGASLVASETGVAMDGEPNPSEGNLRRAGLRPVGVTEHLCPQGATWV